MITILVAAALTVSDADHKFCSEVSSLAETIMDARQSGARYRDVVELIRSDKALTEAERDVAFVVAMDAWEKPSYSSREYQQRERVEFGSEWYAKCIKIRGE